jgi:hypothetical protein
MSTVIRSRRAGLSPEEAKTRPLYARVLGLQYLRPGGLLCFLYFEGSIALGTLLALAELVDWWVVAVLPVTVAAMVKLNDVVAGAIAYAQSAAIPKAHGRAKVPRVASRVAQDRADAPVRAMQAGGSEEGAIPATPISPGAPEWVGSPEQRARQSAVRRYE